VRKFHSLAARIEKRKGEKGEEGAGYLRSGLDGN
jgi:hypothetical protein